MSVISEIYNDDQNEISIAVVGLGYVGLPLAVELAKTYNVFGYDINESRLKELINGYDRNNEVSNNAMAKCGINKFTMDINDIKRCNFYIVTVPTPIDEYNNPNLEPLISTSKRIGAILKKGDIVVFNVTVYPGATEEECVPILEKYSKLRFNVDFFVGYSPERINPGDKEHTVSNVVKVISASNSESLNILDKVYSSVTRGGTYRAESIKVAEAAKVIENVQRDINIALINELAMLFHKLDIDTESVLKAASTKWNFLHFRPGFVGGHCIGIDPYYLTHKAKSVKFNPELILSGRKINDEFSSYVASELAKKMFTIKKGADDLKILLMGVTFKENCPDIRNSKIFDLITALNSFGFNLNVTDPLADKDEVSNTHNITLKNDIHKDKYDVIILAVPHAEYLKNGIGDIKKYLLEDGLFFDLKSAFPPKESDYRI